MADDDEITAALDQLRLQLTKAQEHGVTANIQFAVTEVEIEFLVEITKAAGGSGGLKLGLASLGAGGNVSKGSSHRLKLTLEARDVRSGIEAIVSDRR